MATLLQPSIDEAGEAKNALIERREGVEMATAGLRTELTTVRAESSRMLGRLRAYTPEAPHG
jgi:hypothetical protein